MDDRPSDRCSATLYHGDAGDLVTEDVPPVFWLPQPANGQTQGFSFK